MLCCYVVPVVATLGSRCKVLTHTVKLGGLS